MNKDVLELLMSASKVDARREEMMAEAGAGNEACGYHTAYAWADAVDEATAMLQKQIDVLEKIAGRLYCYDKAQGIVEMAIYQLSLTIEEEDSVLARFWEERPTDFERRV